LSFGHDLVNLGCPPTYISSSSKVLNFMGTYLGNLISLHYLENMLIYSAFVEQTSWIRYPA